MAYTEYVLHSGVTVLAQDAPVGVKSLDELLGGHHWEGVLQQRKITFSNLSSLLEKVISKKTPVYRCVRAREEQETSCPQEIQEAPDWTTPESTV